MYRLEGISSTRFMIMLEYNESNAYYYSNIKLHIAIAMTRGKKHQIAENGRGWEEEEEEEISIITRQSQQKL